MKTTEELFHSIKSSRSIKEFMADNSEDLSTTSVADFLQQMLVKYNTDKATVFKKANMADTNYGYELFRDGKKKASRDKLLQIAFGFPLEPEDCRRLLVCGKVSPLYPRDIRDAYILFGLTNHFTLEQMNILLYDNKEPILE